MLKQLIEEGERICKGHQEGSSEPKGNREHWFASCILFAKEQQWDESIIKLLKKAVEDDEEEKIMGILKAANEFET